MYLIFSVIAFLMVSLYKVFNFNILFTLLRKVKAVMPKAKPLYCNHAQMKVPEKVFKGIKHSISGIKFVNVFAI